MMASASPSLELAARTVRLRRARGLSADGSRLFLGGSLRARLFRAASPLADSRLGLFLVGGRLDGSAPASPRSPGGRLALFLGGSSWRSPRLQSGLTARWLAARVTRPAFRRRPVTSGLAGDEPSERPVGGERSPPPVPRLLHHSAGIASDGLGGGRDSDSGSRRQSSYRPIKRGSALTCGGR